MQSEEAEEVLKSLNLSVSQINWRLKPSSKRRLEIDVLALCLRMRPVVMVDYGGKMPKLQHDLCSLIELLHKESAIFQQLKVMVVDDMIYLLNAREFTEYIAWSLSSEATHLFVDLEHDPPKMISLDAQTEAVKGLVSVQHKFSSVFTADDVKGDVIQGESRSEEKFAESAFANLSKLSKVLDLSSCLQDYQITIPTLNGWLLGYPVIYLFGKDHISDAIYNLSTKPLHLFRVVFNRNVSNTCALPVEELMSFSVPYDLSMNGRNEPWVEAFWLQVQAKQERCNQVWRSLQLEVGECYPQAIAL